MAEKDLTEKMLEAHNDVFADIINVLLFNGQQIVNEGCLVDADKHSMLKADDSTVHEQERDVSKYWQNRLFRIAFLGIENQTDIDEDMPLRTIAYDGAAYKSQILQDRPHKPKQRYPVITLILYFGYEKPWEKPLSLFDRIKVTDREKPYVNDYKINLFQIAYLSDDQVAMFKSDFKIVADYFVQMRKNGKYDPGCEQLHHVHEVLNFLAVMTSDQKFANVFVPQEAERSGWTMRSALDQYYKEGEARGIALGEARGIALGEAGKAQQMSISLHKLGVAVEIIAQSAEYPLSIVQGWIRESEEGLKAE